MCLSPIKIKNNSRRYRDGIDKMFFHVPCGHCKDCLKQSQDDWFVRAFFEYNRIKKLHGHVFFPTFTYNDENLPIYEDKERNFICPSFFHDDIKSFRDKLRVYLSRDWYLYTDDAGHTSYCSCAHDESGDKFRNKYDKDIHYVKFWSGIHANGIRFIIVCEFGSTRGRPHYHALLFCPFDISISIMLRFLRMAWNFGFVGVPEKGLEIGSANGIQYCMKYVSKEQHWTKYYKVNEYVSRLKEDIDKNVPGAEDTLKFFRRCMPKHYQSTNFGSDMCQYITDENLIDGKIDLSDFGFLTKNKFNFKLPRYIVRRLTTYKDEFDLYVPNTRFKELFEDIFKKSLLNDALSYTPYQSFDAFKVHVAPMHLSVEELSQYWKRLCYISDKIPYLVVYNRVYRGVPLSGIGFQFNCEQHDKNELDFFMVHALQFAYKQKCGFVGIPAECGFQPLQTSPELFSDDRLTHANLPCFDYFEDALCLIEDIEKYLGKMQDEAWKYSEFVSANQYRQENRNFYASCA